jgi:hypothetical protein
MVSGRCTRCGVDWALGVVNGYSDTMSDRDNEKGLLGGIKVSRETWAYATNIYYGGDSGDWAPWAFAGFPNTPNGAGRSGDKLGVSDHILWWNPTVQFSDWINYDYYWVENTDNAASGHTGFDKTPRCTLSPWLLGTQSAKRRGSRCAPRGSRGTSTTARRRPS